MESVGGNLSDWETLNSRRTAIFVNIAKLLLLAALTPPAIAGIAHRASELGAGLDAAAIVAATASIGAVFAVVGALGLGALSDICNPTPRSRWLWVLTGTGIGTIGLMALSIGDSRFALIAGWGAAQLGYSGAMAVLRVILASALPQHRRRGAVVAVLGGYVGILIPLIILLVLPGRIWETTFGLAALSFAVPILFLIWTRQELTVVSSSSSTTTAVSEPRALDTRPTNQISGVALLAIQCAAHTVMSAFLSYHPLDLAARVAADAEFPVRSSVWVLVAAIVGLVAASSTLLWYPQLLGNSRRIIVIGGALLAASLVMRAVCEPLPLVAAAATLSGVAVGLNSSALLSMALETVPFRRAGQFIGAFSAAGALGQFIGPLAGLGVLSITTTLAPDAGYSPLFFVLALLPVVWVILVTKRPRSRASGSVYTAPGGQSEPSNN